MKINLKNIQTQLKKGSIEFCVLLIISKGKIYSLDIIKELTKLNIDAPSGTIYPLLAKLEKQEYIKYLYKDGVAGPQRKYYTITMSGKKYLNALKQEWLKLNKSILLLIKQNEK